MAHGRLLLYIRGMSGSKGFVNVFPGFNFISFVEDTEKMEKGLVASLALLGIEGLSAVVDSELTAQERAVACSSRWTSLHGHARRRYSIVIAHVNGHVTDARPSSAKLHSLPKRNNAGPFQLRRRTEGTPACQAGTRWCFEYTMERRWRAC